MTFKLADEVFAGSKKTFAQTVPLGRHGTPEDGTTHSVDGGFTTA
jgi:hypothetical protein